MLRAYRQLTRSSIRTVVWPTRGFSNSPHLKESSEIVRNKGRFTSLFGASQRKGNDWEDSYREMMKDSSDEERTKKIVIKNYQNTKDSKPSVIDIDRVSGEVRSLAKEPRWLSLSSIIFEAKSKFMTTFLPNGYPGSVTKEYTEFSVMSGIGSILATAMGFLSTQSLFVALGSSTTQATQAAAALQWVLKDGLGQLGGILFAAKYGQNFDSDVKKFRFLGLAFLNLSMWIEVTALMFPKLFLLIGTVSNMLKSVCFMLISASRANINMRFSKQNNIADVQGKATSQFIGSSLLGTCLGVGISKFINIGALSQMFPTFAVISLMFYWTSDRSIRIINEIYLNNQRAHILFSNYFEQGMKKFEHFEKVNSIEKYYLPNFCNPHYCGFITYGRNSIGRVLSTSPQYSESMVHQLEKLESEHRKFVYYVELKDNTLLKNRLQASLARDDYRPYTINFNLEKDAKPLDILQSYYLGRLIDHNLRTKVPKDRDVTVEDLKMAKRRSEWQLATTELHEAVIMPMREQGWSEEFIYLENNQNRFEIDRNGQPRHQVQEEEDSGSEIDGEIKENIK